ncbi:MAG: hypothetical protein RLP11_12865 [Marinoscillum sp.]|uniref:hypothetical protein n=1 Tax=Marinoscillum sp. TaxID=2024838 RepID=UPI0032F7AD67
MAVEKIEKALVEAKDKLSQLGIEEQLVSEIEWCLGSYALDLYEVGIYVKGAEAYSALEKFKKTNARKVSKKLLDDLEKAIKSK